MIIYSNEYVNGSACWTNGAEGSYSANLQNSTHASHCSGFYSGNNGSNNENLGHVACELDWCLYYNFGQRGWEVILVGHSMGGLIIRKALQLVQQHNSAVPSNIGHVTDVVTLNVPLGGVYGSSLVNCNGCLQGNQEEPTNNFIIDMLNNAPHPSAGGATDWTTVSSDCSVDGSFPNGDYLVGAASAINLNADHKVVFSSIGNSYGCDSHGNIIHDTHSAFDADAYWCDNYDLSSPANCSGYSLSNRIYGTGSFGNWVWDTAEPCGLKELFKALSSYSW